MVRARRPRIRPNEKFRADLKEYEEKTVKGGEKGKLLEKAKDDDYLNTTAPSFASMESIPLNNQKE